MRISAADVLELGHGLELLRQLTATEKKRELAAVKVQKSPGRLHIHRLVEFLDKLLKEASVELTLEPAQSL